MVCFKRSYDNLIINDRSGTEEEYSELSQLLEGMSTYMRDVAVLFVKEQTDKEDKKKKEASNKNKGEGMRKAAIELIGSKCMHDCVWNVSMIDLS